MSLCTAHLSEVYHVLNTLSGVLNNVVKVRRECGRRRRDYHEIGCVLLDKCVPVAFCGFEQQSEAC